MYDWEVNVEYDNGDVYTDAVKGTEGVAEFATLLEYETVVSVKFSRINMELNKNWRGPGHDPSGNEY